MMNHKDTILLLHKNDLVRKKIEKYLRELDFSVIIAKTINDAYSQAMGMHPDLILWGEALTADAKKMIRDIRTSKDFHDTPVIAMIRDIELYDRIKLEQNGISDIVSDDPELAELRIRIRFHLNNIRRRNRLEKAIRRIQDISELQYNIAILNDANRLSELIDDFILNDYNFNFAVQLIFNARTNVFDYKSLISESGEYKEMTAAILKDPRWKESLSGAARAEAVSGKKQLEFFKSAGLDAEIYFRVPMNAGKKTLGCIIIGCDLDKAPSKTDLRHLSILANSAAQRIFELRKLWSAENEPEQRKPEISDLIQRYNDDDIYEFLTRQVKRKLGTDTCIYFNYNSGFHFLYPQYCFQGDTDLNLFEDDKPPVLMARDYATFESFRKSRKSHAVYNDGDGEFDDLMAMAQLAGGRYDTVVLFEVKVGNEIKGYLLAANESGMKRFSSALLNEARELVRKASDVLMESRLVKQAHQTVKQLDRVFELGKDLTLESHINELLPKIATAIRRTLGWNIVLLDRKDSYSDTFTNVCYLGIRDTVFEKIEARYPNTMYQQMKERSFRISNSYFLDHKYVKTRIDEDDVEQFRALIGKEWSDRDWLFVPIRSRGKELGVISVNDPVDRIRPNEEKVRSLEYFANQAAVALENASLYENLKHSENRYRALAETMTMGLLTCRLDGDIVYCNSSFAGMTRYSDTEALLGNNLFNLTGSKYRNDLEKYILMVSRPAEEVSEKERARFENGLEIEVMASDNEYIPFKIYLTATQEQAFDKGFVAVLSDMRPQRRIERLKSDFNSMVVHDLRSPLNIIQGYIEIVRNKVVGEISSEQEELLTIAKENCYKVLKLVDNFLIASKLEVGQFKVNPEVNALNTLIESVFENHLVLARKKNISMEIRLDEKVPLMAFDKMRIEQVLTNYLSNALKFTNNDGRIEVGSKLLEQRQALSGKSRQEVQIWVKDSGVGISEEEQAKVFSKYEQTEAGKDASLKGTGLGLAICKEIVSLHNGKVWLESTPGQGSTFYFSLPVNINLN